MVMLVWFILSLFGVCSFTWLPVLIDTAIYTVYVLLKKDDDSYFPYALGTITLGVAGFAFYKVFFDLAISAWWVIISPLAYFLMLAFPGGFTIVNLLFKNYGLIELPTWGLILGIIGDVFFLVAFILLIVEYAGSKKRK